MGSIAHVAEIHDAYTYAYPYTYCHAWIQKCKTQRCPYTHTCILYTWQSRTPTISGVKVEKMLIEVDVQMRDVCYFGEQGFAALGCVGRYTLCSR